MRFDPDQLQDILAKELDHLNRMTSGDHCIALIQIELVSRLDTMTEVLSEIRDHFCDLFDQKMFADRLEELKKSGKS